MKAVESEAVSAMPDAFLGVYDYSYAPYALGDCLTWQEKILCGAIDHGYSKIRLCLVTDPWRPSCYLQPHINTLNYPQFIQSLYPAMFSNPLVESVQVFRDRYAFNLFLFTAWRKGIASWPSYEDHFNCELDYISHKEINAFYDKHGYLPRLAAPRGYEAAVDGFIERYGRRRYLVTCNIRLSQMSRYPADINRDSPIEVWHRFFALVGARYPDVLFLYLGGYGEWDANMSKHPNVVIMRGIGFNLGHELAMIHRSDMFIGSSSGFAAAATFSKTPYVITNMEPRFSRFNGVPVDEPRYPFGLDHQYISWVPETPELLMENFERVYRATKGQREAAAQAAHAGDQVPAAPSSAVARAI